MRIKRLLTIAGVILAMGFAVARGQDAKTPATGADVPRKAAPATQKSPPVIFMGVGDKAMRAVFLCDSSGSMMTKFDSLRTEIRKSVNQLMPAQTFGVIFFSEESYITLGKSPLAASPLNKGKASEFLDKTAPHGSSDPIPGIRAAFAAEPQVIFLLTDGDFPNNAQVQEEIRKLNKDKKVRVNTIAFMDRGEEYEKLLKTIADENGGTYKFVADNELEK